MIYSDNSFSPLRPCKCEGRCIRRDSFYSLRDFFFSWNRIKSSDWIHSSQHTDWWLELVWTWPQQWLFYGPNLRRGSDLLTWILWDWKKSLRESWHLDTLPFDFSENLPCSLVSTNNSGDIEEWIILSCWGTATEQE